MKTANDMNKWGEYLSASRSSGLFSDILLSTPSGGKSPPFQGHKLLLGTQWFLKETQDSDALILEGFRPQVLEHFLDILYAGHTKCSGEEDLKSLRDLSELFGLRNLETFVFEEDDDFEDELYYYESDESEENDEEGSSLTVTLEENLSKADIILGGRVFVCPRCGEGFPSEAKLEVHEKGHHEEDYEEYLEEEEEDIEGHPCKHCCLPGQSFASKTELERHAFKCHEEARSCPKCGKAFKEPKSLLYHSRYVCPKIKREFFKCALCESKFPSPRDARRHEKSAHGRPKPVKCPYCSISCRSSSFLTNHIKVAHNPERLRFKCSSCGKAFLKAAYLEDHLHRFHSSEKTFECPSCAKRFSTKQDLNRHSKTAHEGPSHACSYCEKTFTYRSTLTQHVRSAHTGDRPYHCRPCNKGFAFLEVLKKHKKSHDRKGDQTIIVTAPKGVKGNKSYIDFSPGNAFPSTSFVQDLAFDSNQGGFPSYAPPAAPGYPKEEPQITAIDIMELLSKN